jgi:hypothetical protein
MYRKSLTPYQKTLILYKKINMRVTSQQRKIAHQFLLDLEQKEHPQYLVQTPGALQEYTATHLALCMTHTTEHHLY